MSFLHPAAVWIGAFALLIPLGIHFLSRPRPKSLPLSTIQFVFEAIQQRRARNRFRDLLVLMLRVLAISLLALAIARPFFSRQVVIRPDDSDVEISRVILVDVSQSMSAGRAGNQPLQRGKSVVDRYLETRPGLICSVIMADANPTTVFDQFSSNLDALRSSVRSVDVSAQQCDAMAAISRAAELLTRTNPEMKRELIVVSDFQRNDWGAVRFDALPADTSVQMEAVGFPGTDNVAIIGVQTPGRITPGVAVTLEVEIANYGDSVRSVECRLSLGAIRQSISVAVPVGESTVAYSIQLDEAGWFSGEVELVGLVDDLPADDRFALAIKASGAPKVGLLSGGDPARKPSSTYYLSKAVARLGIESEPDTTFDPREFSDETDVDVLVVDHPGQLSPAAVRALSGRLSRGTGVLYLVSELADGVNLEALGQEMGAGLQLPVQFIAPNQGSTRRELSVMEVNRREPPFEVFGDALDVALASIRIGGGLETREADEALKDRVLARLSDRSAFLVAADAGAGKLFVLNADLDRSNLAVRPAFLPLLAELIDASLTTKDALGSAVCGSPVVRRLPASLSIDDRIEGKPADGWPELADGYGSWEATATGMIWNWEQPNNEGVYVVQSEGQIVDAVAVNAPASESDLKTLDSGFLDAQGKGEQRLGFRNVREDGMEQDGLWSWLLVACVIGMVCEICALRISRT